MSILLDIKNITFSFGSFTLLKEISLQCKTGDITGILGRNGSGKSTLLQVIFGTLKPDAGVIRHNGKHFMKPLYSGTNCISYLPQENFLPGSLTVKKSIELCINDKKIREKLLLDERINKLESIKVAKLSGGEIRYLEVLIILNLTADFVLLDEPFSEIEPNYIDLIKKYIQDCTVEKGVMITDHNYEHVLDICNNQFLIQNGKLINFKGTKILKQRQYIPKTEDEAVTPFFVDKQTLRDINIINERPGIDSIFDFFNNTRTTGGMLQLEEFFLQPSTDSNKIKTIQSTISYLSDNLDHFDLKFFTDNVVKGLEYYLDNTFIPLELKNRPGSKFKAFLFKRVHRNDFAILKTGVLNFSRFLYNLKLFYDWNINDQLSDQLTTYFIMIEEILFHPLISKLISKNQHHISAFDLFTFDYLIRKTLPAKIKHLISKLYDLEAYISMAKTVKKNSLIFPEIISDQSVIVDITGVKHLFVQNAVPNSCKLQDTTNLIFLTGPNMAGKTTYMKAVAVAIYLAHLGLAVPAKAMKLTLFDAMLTGINTEDNIRKGYSYFFSEVTRVKEAAIIIKEYDRVFIMFDELFKGTNVKDAYDSSKLVIQGFLKKKKHFFILSSHLTELEKEIDTYQNIEFKCFDSTIENDIPIYSYKLMDGISHKRMGLSILKSEKIPELLADDEYRTT